MAKMRTPIPRNFMPPSCDEILLRPEEVASWTGTPLNTLRWWRQTGRGPRFVRVESKPRYLSGDIRSFLAHAEA